MRLIAVTLEGCGYTIKARLRGLNSAHLIKKWYNPKKIGILEVGKE
jgi:hypothetical protein